MILLEMYCCCRVLSSFFAGALSFCKKRSSVGCGRRLWVAAQCGVPGSCVAAQSSWRTMRQLVPLCGHVCWSCVLCRMGLNICFLCFLLLCPCANRTNNVQMTGRQDVGERDRGGGGYEVRPRIHLTLLRDGIEDADVRNGKPRHPHRGEEGKLLFSRSERESACAEQTSAAHFSLSILKNTLSLHCLFGVPWERTHPCYPSVFTQGPERYPISMRQQSYVCVNNASASFYQ